MKRKLGVALLVVATALAGTPEAVTQFRDLNAALSRWASNNLGGSFLVYAEGTNERALPDRYDYHSVAPVVRPSALDQSASGYGLMASLSAPLNAPAAHTQASCPMQQQRRALETAAARTPRPRVVEARAARQVARRTERTEASAEVARELERAVNLTTKALGAKLRVLKLEDETEGAVLVDQLKALRLKAATEARKERRAAERTRVVSFTQPWPAPVAVPAVELTAPALPAYVALARRQNEEEARPGAAPDTNGKRRDAKARRNTRPEGPNARPVEPRQFDVSPFVIMASTQTDATGFDCDDNR
jgi:hypothetical protein